MTIRKQIIGMLSEYPHGARELSQALHISEKEVYVHLEHIQKTAKSMGKKIVIEPAECLQCSFVFKQRKRFTPPGRCPKCQGSHIQRPVYGIEAVK